jgi:bla regulator protein blaR1
MIAYLVKMIVCSGLLLAVYFLLLEKEKMHRFNRFYLLFSIIFSLTIPLVSITVSTIAIPVLEAPAYPLLFEAGPANAEDPVLPNAQPREKTNIFPLVLLALYCTVTFYFLFRLFITVYRLTGKTGKYRCLYYENAKLVFLNEKIATHTFLNTIFVGESDHKDQVMDKEVLTHELTHVRQKHSLDIIFIELLRSILWFNPFFTLYKKAIQLNHEFLADDAVISTHKNISSYQYLLLDKIKLHSGSYLSSNLNFLIAKKRLAMMKQMKNTPRAVLKTIGVAALFAGSVILFSEKVIAQQPVKNSTPSVPAEKNSPAKKDTTTAKKPSVEKFPPSGVSWGTPDGSPPISWGKKPGYDKNPPGPGVSQELFNEYTSAVQNSFDKRGEKNGMVYWQLNEGFDVKRMRSIYKAMTKEQQEKAPHIPGTIPKLPPPVKKIPTEDQLMSWQNAAVYGVWIDEKKVRNEVLADYKASDFAAFSISKLYGSAKVNKTYTHQLNLQTPAYFDKIYKQWEQD